MVHRVAAEGAVGVEDVPFDEEGALFGFGEAFKVVPCLFRHVVKLGVVEVFESDGGGGCFFLRGCEKSQTREDLASLRAIMRQAAT